MNLNATPVELAEVEHMLQIASGELVLVRGTFRLEETGEATPVEFYVPAKHAVVAG